MLLADGRRPDKGHRHPPRPPWGARVTTPLEIREFILCALSLSLSFFLSLFLSLAVIALCGAAASTPRQMMDNIVVVQTV